MDSASLGVDDETGEPVLLGLTERRQGLYVIGKNGMGKTTLLEHLIVQDIEAGLGLCVLDPHGDLVDSVLGRIPAHREQDVILLDLEDSQFPFGLNLFECSDTTNRNLVGRVAAQAVEVFEKLWGDTSWGPQLAQVLRNCAYTMVENPGYTMAELRLLLLDEDFRNRLVAKVTNPQVVEFWKLEYDALRPQDRLQMVRSTLNKVDEFLTPTVYPIVGFGKTTVDFRDVMDTGKIVLVQLKAGPIGKGPAGLIGSILVGQILNAALSRQDLPPSQRRQFHLYADEYQRFATPAFGELLTEARKYAVATTLAHQYRSQLPDAENRGATLNAGNLVVFGVTGEDAEELAKQFDRSPPAPEVVGHRPTLSVCQDAVGHLVRSGHEDPRVRDLVQKSVGGWAALAERLGEEPSCDTGISSPGTLYYVSRAQIRGGLVRLNKLLVTAMEARARPSDTEFAVGLVEVIGAIDSIIGFSGIPVGARSRQKPNGSLRALRTWIEHYLHSVTPFRVHSTMLIGADFDEIVNARISENRDAPSVMDIENARRISQQEAFRVCNVVFTLHELVDKLAADPILADSGQWEPIYDRPRTYADVEGEIASSLVNLPKFRARVRLLTPEGPEEHTLRTPRFDGRRALEGDPERVERIRRRTRAEYCAPLDDVLAGIRRRQTGDEPPSAGSTQRRVPLK